MKALPVRTFLYETRNNDYGPRVVSVRLLKDGNLVTEMNLRYIARGYGDLYGYLGCDAVERGIRNERRLKQTRPNPKSLEAL